jgi:2-polyprenyl-3-methyl-5-hydroxy-6-metoxy-1,4-benzoquinol methylase
MDLQLCEFPRLKSVRGLGISDSEIYADRLTECFGYTNTFYHQEPAFDLSRPDETEFGKYDFVICSDVLEHVSLPVERSFESLVRLLKPFGVLIFTVPYTLAE